ncbi:MAG TPA: DUF192 domain-containing protein [Nitrososphaeraceae archaeon]|nr:DUF192 domain-containing protein [Nitrososphaeraceae archaeon]
MVRKITVLLPVIVGCVILGILGLIFVPDGIKNRNIEFSKGTIAINNRSISTEIAETPAERQRWLTFRSEEMPVSSALLLVYDKADLYSLWLLNIQFNIDLIWFDGAGNIVYIKQDAAPCKNTLDAVQCTYKNTIPARYVLAATTGFINYHNITKNSKITLVSV